MPKLNLKKLANSGVELGSNFYHLVKWFTLLDSAADNGYGINGDLAVAIYQAFGGEIDDSDSSYNSAENIRTLGNVLIFAAEHFIPSAIYYCATKQPAAEDLRKTQDKADAFGIQVLPGRVTSFFKTTFADPFCPSQGSSSAMTDGTGYTPLDNVP